MKALVSKNKLRFRTEIEAASFVSIAADITGPAFILELNEKVVRLRSAAYVL